MLSSDPVWNQLMGLVGEVTLLLIVGMLLFSLLLVIIAVFSIKNGRFYFPNLLKSGMVLMEGFIKAICRLLRISDKDLTVFFIRLHNVMNMRAFEQVPVGQRAIFLPQCLRSAECPAHLTPEGLVCRRCGRCGVGQTIDELEGMGYRVFIVPGSTFIKRIAKRYHPKAIIGVGCLVEVKDGIEMADQMGLIAMGVITLKDGCVETVLNWHDLVDLAGAGLAPGSLSDDFHVSAG